jgi:aryl-alcohol dehydrogenase-like predicted oxidoreductase
MMQRLLGATGLQVPVIGLGAMQLGDPAMTEEDAAGLLHGALDLGVTLIDTARAYGMAEERIGRALASRRDEFVLSTKLGYGVRGVPDWSAESVRRGVDAARDRLRTDVIDIVHLHSCPLDVLRHGCVLEALAAAVESGKVRVAAYSGENPALEWALTQPAIGSVQVSVNVCDQAVLRGQLTMAAARGIGVLAKRPLATAPWRGNGAEPVYAERFRALAGALEPMEDWADTALRFAAFAPGVHCCLVGTRSLAHLASAVAAVEHGPLGPPPMAAIGAAFDRLGAGWGGVV